LRPSGSYGRNSEGFLPWQPGRQHAKCWETKPPPDPYTSEHKEAVMTQPLGDQARDERELTQLVKDLNKAVVKADVAVLE
jgi:hypothetical protein